MGDRPLVQAQGLKKDFASGGGLRRNRSIVHAVDDVTLDVREGETLGIVGESGCGKSTLARLLVRLIEPTTGRVVFDGVELTALPSRALKRRRVDFQMVFQDPYASINPRMTVRRVLEEPLVTHGIRGGDRKERLKEMMEHVGLPPVFLERHAHELSGGQRQRIGIARALALHPRFVVCDEPVAALDVSIQAQVLNLLQDLQQEYGLTYLFIAHDLAVVKYISSRIGVMYLGRLVELGFADELHAHPLHPYTSLLLKAIPIPAPGRRRRGAEEPPAEGPSPTHPPSGCPFHPRCPFAVERCRHERPDLRELAPGHVVACHRAGEADLRGRLLSA